MNMDLKHGLWKMNLKYGSWNKEPEIWIVWSKLNGYQLNFLRKRASVDTSRHHFHLLVSKNCESSSRCNMNLGSAAVSSCGFSCGLWKSVSETLAVLLVHLELSPHHRKTGKATRPTNKKRGKGEKQICLVSALAVFLRER
jgi:hypothetical protein